MIRYVVTIFLSSFLLFMVQPIAAKFLVPVFGGSSAVWTSCMMFFQVALLLGYLYAHLLRQVFGPAAGFAIHCFGLIAATWFLDLGSLNSVDAEPSLVLSVCKRLLVCLGIPFAVLSATAPLIQAWHSCSHQGSASTYRLYACSNIGALLALIGYPFIADEIGLYQQSDLWSLMFYVFVLFVFLAGLQVAGKSSWSQEEGRAAAGDSMDQSISVFQLAIWLTGTATASLLLLSTTNLLSQEVASYPFLWMLPLTLYLISFIVCFDRPYWYQRYWAIPMFSVAVFVAILLLHLGPNAGLILQAVGFGAVVFFGSMICHGEVYRQRPNVSGLTVFYLCIALGGAIGSVAAVVGAPMIFDHFYEFHCALIFCLLILFFCVFYDCLKNRTVSSRWMYLAAFVSLATSSPVVSSWMFLADSRERADLLFRERNEYGIVSVTENDGYRKMYNGQTNHGGQFLDLEKRGLPSAYYSSGSGADIAFQIARRHNRELDVCIIGLGTGSMLGFSKVSDSFRFYEINPLSLVAAKDYFTYLDTYEADVIIGDGRVELQKENENGQEYDFNLLFVDAFSSDSIPVHLLTKQCVELYLRNLAEDGVLVFHITNKFMDLIPVLDAIRQTHSLYAVVIDHKNTSFQIETKWVLMSRSQSTFEENSMQEAQSNWPLGVQPVHWTDELAPVSPLVIWSGKLNLGK